MIPGSLPIPVWRNALTNRDSFVNLSQDMEVYEAVVDDAVDRFYNSNYSKPQRDRFRRALEWVESARTKIHRMLTEGTPVGAPQINQFKRAVEELNRVSTVSEEDWLVDNLLEGTIGEGRLDSWGRYVVKAYLDSDSDSWWEDRGSRADSKLDSDIGAMLSRLVDEDGYRADIHLYYMVDRETGEPLFNFARVNGYKIPDTIGIHFWSYWEDSVKKELDIL